MATTKNGWGGRREGAGRKKKTDEQRAIDRTRERKPKLELADTPDLLDVVGPAPSYRLRLHLAEPESVADPRLEADWQYTDGHWFARFCELLLVHYEGPFAGRPFVLEPFQVEFVVDALTFDDEGLLLYETAIFEIPRKNGKSTLIAALGLALGSPAYGEAKPEIVLAAGSAKQANEIFEPATIFTRNNATLSAIYRTLLTAISCLENLGSIFRIAADGERQHGLNPFHVLADELHVWTQPTQVALWTALRSAFGARRQRRMTVISTAGFDGTSLFGAMMDWARKHPLAEKRSEMGGGGFVLRDLESKTLVHAYEVALETPLDDLGSWKAANPATWRTPERIAEDLADPLLDESSKRRLYGNEWTSAESRWISSDAWRACLDPDASPENPDWIPAGETVRAGADAAITHDCTAIGWAWQRPDGKVAIRARVWSVKPTFPAHVFVTGGRLDNEDAELFVSDELAVRHPIYSLIYDPRYFTTEAAHLSQLGMSLIEMAQGSSEKKNAQQEFYKAVKQGRIVHDGDPILAAHVGAADAKWTPRGWQISHDPEKPIDALDAVVMAAYLVLRGEGEAWVASW